MKKDLHPKYIPAEANIPRNRMATLTHRHHLRVARELLLFPT